VFNTYKSKLCGRIGCEIIPSRLLKSSLTADRQALGEVGRDLNSCLSLISMQKKLSKLIMLKVFSQRQNGWRDFPETIGGNRCPWTARRHETF